MSGKADIDRTCHSGTLPGSAKRPNIAFTQTLLRDAKDRVPRLRFELTEMTLCNFLLDEERIGVVCQKYRTAAANGWMFPPLSDCREAWERRYGAQRWDNPTPKDWLSKVHGGIG